MSSHFASAHFGSGHYESSHYGRLAIIPPVEEETGATVGIYPREDKWLEDDDEVLLAVVAAFMEMID